MQINWGLAQSPDLGSAALGGYEAGQALRMRQAQTELLQRRADMEEQQFQRETELEKRKMELLPKIMGGTVNAPAPADGGAMPAATPAEAGAAPTPNQPRRDGMQINWDALAQYAALGGDASEEANQIARFAVMASKEQIEAVQRQGTTLARSAAILRKAPMAQRPALFAQMRGELEALGVPPEAINAAASTLDDASLDTAIRKGMTLEQMIAKDDRDRSFQASEARAARGEARAERADARAAVRFQERDKDRAALAASGGGRVRTDLEDLDY